MSDFNLLGRGRVEADGRRAVFLKLDVTTTVRFNPAHVQMQTAVAISLKLLRRSVVLAIF